MVRAGAGDLFAGVADEVDDAEQLRHEARCVAQRSESIGFQQGVLDARQAHVQDGFDAGYHAGAVAAFCAAFGQAQKAATAELPVQSIAAAVSEDLHREVQEAIAAAALAAAVTARP